MLPPTHRLRHAADFSATVRRGRRAGGRSLVVHQLRHDGPAGDDRAGVDAARVGFVVSKAVGGSVVRHRVARRLRAQLAMRIDALDPCTDTVVRALPNSAVATSVELGDELDRALRRVGAVTPAGRQ